MTEREKELFNRNRELLEIIKHNEETLNSAEKLINTLINSMKLTLDTKDLKHVKKTLEWIQYMQEDESRKH